jgi:hypothetical protein
VDEIATALTLVLGVSVAVERVTEILKQMIPLLAKERSDENAENRRRASLQILSAVVGTVIAWQGQLQLAGHSGGVVYLLIGAMSSGGSAFWNHALDAVRASKVTREAIAEEAETRVKELKAVAKLA